MSNRKCERVDKCNPEIIRIRTNIVVDNAEKWRNKSKCATTLFQLPSQRCNSRSRKRHRERKDAYASQSKASGHHCSYESRPGEVALGQIVGINVGGRGIIEVLDDGRGPFFFMITICCRHCMPAATRVDRHLVEDQVGIEVRCGWKSSRSSHSEVWGSKLETLISESRPVSEEPKSNSPNAIEQPECRLIRSEACLNK